MQLKKKAEEYFYYNPFLDYAINLVPCEHITVVYCAGESAVGALYRYSPPLYHSFKIWVRVREFVAMGALLL